MNSLLILPDELNASLAVIKGERAEYIRQFHKPEIGLELQAAIFNDCLCRVKVLRIENVIELEVISKSPAPELKDIQLILGVSRPPTVAKIIEFASCYGISDLIFISTQNTQAGYLTSKIWRDLEQHKSLVKGLEQGVGCYAPRITKLDRFKELSKVKFLNNKFICSPKAESQNIQSLSEFSASLAFGPEAGFTDLEEKSFTELGFSPVSLGSQILRQEYAVVFALGKLSSSFQTCSNP